VATVVGIFPDHTSVSKLIENLSAAGHDVSRAHVLCNEDIPTDICESGVKCTWIGDVNRTMAGGGSLSAADGMSINVPGLSGSGGGDVVYGDSINDYLAELNVPDARTDDYAIAVEAGRTVAGYRADDGQAEALRGAFSSAGATVVDVF
jgi:hypothetical protein